MSWMMWPANAWLASKVDLKPGTAGRYARELRLYILPKWGGMTLRELRPDMLQEWVGQLMDGGYPAALPDGRDSKAAEREKHPQYHESRPQRHL